MFGVRFSVPFGYILGSINLFSASFGSLPRLTYNRAAFGSKWDVLRSLTQSERTKQI